MRVSSTVLFMDGQPVGYSVQERDGRSWLHPAESPFRRANPAPVMEALLQNGEWKILGNEDPELVAQALEELHRLYLVGDTKLSAAP